MVTGLRQNNINFVRLVFSMDHFTEAELLKRYRETYGDNAAVEGHPTIRGYLDDLRDAGLIDYENGKYSFTKPQP